MLGDCPIKTNYYSLFQITSDPDLEVAKAWVNGQWVIQFRRELDDTRRNEWAELQMLLGEIQLNEGTDNIYWILECSKKYSTRFL